MGKDHHCNRCEQPDNEEMVQCDHCDRWFHFACVRVDSDIANHDWSCDTCIQNTTTAINNGVRGLSTASPTIGTATTTPLLQPAAVTTYLSISSTGHLSGQQEASAYNAIATPTTTTIGDSSSRVFP